MVATQEHREIAFFSPLGEDILLFHRMVGTEGLSQLYEYEVDLLSEDHNIQAEAVLGQNVCVRLNVGEEGERFFNGFASRFSYLDSDAGMAHYRVVLRPWLWLLSRTTDCRVFQRKTVLQIAEDCFREHGFTDFEVRLMGEYQEHEYRVQYNESLCQFLCRLMEEEGIYFYFTHERDKHTLIFADSYSAHDLDPEYESVPFYPPSVAAIRERDHITHWSIDQELQTGVVTLNAYDSMKPKGQRIARAADPAAHAYSDFEVYDYADNFVSTGVGEGYARIRLEELQAQYRVAQARGNTRGLYAGGLFGLINHPRDDQNGEYLIVSASYELQSDAFMSTATAEGAQAFACSLTAIDSQCPYRPPRITPKTFIKGPQTATVVGDDEIWTDEYGRVKIQFHWDREGKMDDQSSRWIPVVQNRAGKGWGEVYLPHPGQEAVISFIRGDPDLPVVTGRLYNADNKPPLDLPADKTKLAMRDHGGNQIVMQGKGGEQQIAIYSPIEESMISIGAPNSPWNNVFRSLGTAQTSWAGGAHLTEVDGGGNETKTVNANTTTNLHGWKFTHITGWEKTFTDADKESITLGNSISYTQGLSNTTRVGADNSLSLALKHSTTVGVDVGEFVGAKAAYSMSASVSRTAGVRADWSAASDLRNRSGNSIENCSARIVKTSAAASAYQAGALMYVTGKPLELNGVGSAKLTSGGAMIRLVSGSVEITGGPIRLKGDVIIEKDLVVNGKINDK